jgi:hypothetical protein
LEAPALFYRLYIITELVHGSSTTVYNKLALTTSAHFPTHLAS